MLINYYAKNEADMLRVDRNITVKFLYSLNIVLGEPEMLGVSIDRSHECAGILRMF